MFSGELVSSCLINSDLDSHCKHQRHFLWFTIKKASDFNKGSFGLLFSGDNKLQKSCLQKRQKIPRQSLQLLLSLFQQPLRNNPLVSLTKVAPFSLLHRQIYLKTCIVAWVPNLKYSILDTWTSAQLSFHKQQTRSSTDPINTMALWILCQILYLVTLVMFTVSTYQHNRVGFVLMRTEHKPAFLEFLKASQLPWISVAKNNLNAMLDLGNTDSS